DPIDEFWPQVVGSYQGKQFQSVTRSSADLEAIEGQEEQARDEERAETLEGSELATLVAWLKTSLEGAVKDVRASKRLTTSPVCLVADEGDIDLHLARLLRQTQRGAPEAARVLEINPGHPLIHKLASEIKAGGQGRDELVDAAQLLLDQARIMEGEPPQDSAAFARRMSAFIERAIA